MTGGEPRSRTLRIGITGPIGCGKSQVARWLGERGVHVVDADEEARAVTAPGGSVHDAVVRRWPAAAAADGTLDRAALGRIVFADPAALRELEALVHPAVRPRILARIAAAEAVDAPAIAIEAIKLVEGGLATECDEVWLVTCDPDTQRDRLTGRGTARYGRRPARRRAGRARGPARPARDAHPRHERHGVRDRGDGRRGAGRRPRRATPDMNAARPGEPGRAVGGASGQRRATEGAARSGVLPGSAVTGPPP